MESLRSRERKNLRRSGNVGHPFENLLTREKRNEEAIADISLALNTTACSPRCLAKVAWTCHVSSEEGFANNVEKDFFVKEGEEEPVWPPPSGGGQPRLPCKSKQIVQKNLSKAKAKAKEKEKAKTKAKRKSSLSVEISQQCFHHGWNEGCCRTINAGATIRPIIDAGIRNGQETNFWCDRWHPIGPLYLHFSENWLAGFNLSKSDPLAKCFCAVPYFRLILMQSWSRRGGGRRGKN